MSLAWSLRALRRMRSSVHVIGKSYPWGGKVGISHVLAQLANRLSHVGEPGRLPKEVKTGDEAKCRADAAQKAAERPAAVIDLSQSRACINISGNELLTAFQARSSTALKPQVILDTTENVPGIGTVG